MREPEVEEILAQENTRLAAMLRRVRLRLDAVLRRVETEGLGHERHANDGERVARLEEITADLLAAVADARRIAGRGVRPRDDQIASGAEDERMSPPLREVIEELRKR
jgi:hypothetical protein